MVEAKRSLLTVAALLIAIVVAIMLYAAKAIDWTFIAPVALIIFGCWFLALAAIRAGTPQKYERNPFSTALLGVLLVAVGGAWFLFSFNWLYALALLLLVGAAVAVAAALKRK